MSPMTASLNPQFNQGTRLQEAHPGQKGQKPYRGRFAPSPTGPLHLGSLTTALGSWLDARAHGGKWLVRIEDVDTPRTVPGADQIILEQLKAYGLEWDEEPTWQSKRTSLYQKVLDQLIAKGLIYGCQCSRKQIENALHQVGISMSPNQELIYPGTCREQHLSFENHALRMRLPEDCVIDFVDRRLGHQSQDLNREVGDFVLQRADGLFTYQLAVVVDDHLQGITHVVRGADLLSNTARQIHLQRALGYKTPHYLHLPLVTNTTGEKLSKQTQAAAIEMHSREIILATLNRAAHYLGISQIVGAEGGAISIKRWLMYALRAWKEVYS
jgi:glutamyl-Q tRNA(Asp) synthetase